MNGNYYLAKNYKEQQAQYFEQTLEILKFFLTNGKHKCQQVKIRKVRKREEQKYVEVKRRPRKKKATIVLPFKLKPIIITHDTEREYGV